MAALIERGLRLEGHAVDLATSGEDALWMADVHPYDVIVLDVMLPGIDGLVTCRRLREARIWSPVLMLTARNSVEDRVAGLDVGADDYLRKPFALAELLARLRALLRRGPSERPQSLTIGGLCLNPAARRVSRDGVEIALTSKEFALLEVLMGRAGQVLSRYDLLEHAWDMHYENRSNIIDVYIRRLREQIDRPFGECSIETVRRVGYRFRLPPARERP